MVSNSSSLPPTRKAGFAAWIIWIALVQAVVIYFFVLKMVVSPPAEMADPSQGSLKLPFLIIGVVAVLISLILRFVITVRAKEFQKAWISYLVSLALAELPAILGLVLGLQGIPIEELYPFFAMGLLGLLAQPPTILPKLHASEIV